MNCFFKKFRKITFSSFNDLYQVSPVKSLTVHGIIYTLIKIPFALTYDRVLVEFASYALLK